MEFQTSYDLTFLYGYHMEGLFENYHFADHMQTFYPLSPISSKKSLKPLPEAYQEFVDKFDTVVLIAFGTTYMPNY